MESRAGGWRERVQETEARKGLLETGLWRNLNELNWTLKNQHVANKVTISSVHMLAQPVELRILLRFSRLDHMGSEAGWWGPWENSVSTICIMEITANYVIGSVVIIINRFVNWDQYFLIAVAFLGSIWSPSVPLFISEFGSERPSPNRSYVKNVVKQSSCYVHIKTHTHTNNAIHCNGAAIKKLTQTFYCIIGIYAEMFWNKPTINTFSILENIFLASFTYN